MTQRFIRDADGQFAKIPGSGGVDLKKLAKRDRARKRREAAKAAAAPAPEAAPIAAVVEKPAAPAGGVDRAAAKRERARKRREAARASAAAPEAAAPPEAASKPAARSWEMTPEKLAEVEARQARLRQETREKAKARKAEREAAEPKAPPLKARTTVVPVAVKELDERTIRYMPPQLQGVVNMRADRERRRQKVMADPKMRAEIEALAPTLRRQAEAPIQIAISGDKLEKLIAAGRFKTAHERVSGIGKGIPGYMKARKGYEDQIMNVGDVDNKERPVYGYAGLKGNRAAAEAYGEFHAVLNDDVKDRSTMTFGDSLNGALPPIAHNKVATASIDELLDARNNTDMYWMGTGDDGNTPVTKGSLAPADYTEVQVHGGVQLSDVKAFKVNRTKIVNRLEGKTIGPDIRARLEKDRDDTLKLMDKRIAQLKEAGFDVLVS